jgi:hypothetical protein
MAHATRGSIPAGMLPGGGVDGRLPASSSRERASTETSTRRVVAKVPVVAARTGAQLRNALFVKLHMPSGNSAASPSSPAARQLPGHSRTRSASYAHALRSVARSMIDEVTVDTLDDLSGDSPPEAAARFGRSSSMTLPDRFDDRAPTASEHVAEIEELKANETSGADVPRGTAVPVAAVSRTLGAKGPLRRPGPRSGQDLRMNLLRKMKQLEQSQVTSKSLAAEEMERAGRGRARSSGSVDDLVVQAPDVCSYVPVVAAASQQHAESAAVAAEAANAAARMRRRLQRRARRAAAKLHAEGIQTHYSDVGRLDSHDGVSTDPHGATSASDAVTDDESTGESEDEVEAAPGPVEPVPRGAVTALPLPPRIHGVTTTDVRQAVTLMVLHADRRARWGRTRERVVEHQVRRHGTNWVPSVNVKECQHCGARFGLLLRKHHCRLCGACLCAACLPHSSPAVARCCRRCHALARGAIFWQPRLFPSSPSQPPAPGDAPPAPRQTADISAVTSAVAQALWSDCKLRSDPVHSDCKVSSSRVHLSPTDLHQAELLVRDLCRRPDWILNAHGRKQQSVKTEHGTFCFDSIDWATAGADADMFLDAAAGGHVDEVRARVLHGQPPTSRLPSTGHTPLHAAAGNGSVDVIRELVSGFAVAADLRAFDGKTPLHCAAMFGQAAAAKALLQAGADASAEDGDGFTPLDLAWLNGHGWAMTAALHINTPIVNAAKAVEASKRAMEPSGKSPAYSSLPIVLGVLMALRDAGMIASKTTVDDLLRTSSSFTGPIDPATLTLTGDEVTAALGGTAEALRWMVAQPSPTAEAASARSAATREAASRAVSDAKSRVLGRKDRALLKAPESVLARSERLLATALASYDASTVIVTARPTNEDRGSSSHKASSASMVSEDSMMDGGDKGGGGSARTLTLRMPPRAELMASGLASLDPAAQALQANLMAVVNAEIRLVQSQTWRIDTSLWPDSGMSMSSGERWVQRFESCGMLEPARRHTRASGTDERRLVGETWKLGHWYGGDADLSVLIDEIAEERGLVSFRARPVAPAGSDDEEAALPLPAALSEPSVVPSGETAASPTQDGSSLVSSLTAQVGMQDRDVLSSSASVLALAAASTATATATAAASPPLEPVFEEVEQPESSPVGAGGLAAMFAARRPSDENVPQPAVPLPELNWEDTRDMYFHSRHQQHGGHRRRWSSRGDSLSHSPEQNLASSAPDGGWITKAAPPGEVASPPHGSSVPDRTSGFLPRKASGERSPTWRELPGSRSLQP